MDEKLLQLALELVQGDEDAHIELIEQLSDKEEVIEKHISACAIPGFDCKVCRAYRCHACGKSIYTAFTLRCDECEHEAWQEYMAECHHG